MSIAIIAFPNMSDEHYQWIDTLRQKHPTLVYEAVKPHFTFVFPITDSIDSKKIIAHIDSVVEQTEVFQFAIRSAVPSPDADWTSKRNYVFLVPDEGFSKIIKLHDALYTGILSKHLKFEIPYLPHITIGYYDDVQLVKHISKDINRQNIEISGMIDMLTLMDNKSGKWNRVQDFALSG